MCLCQETVIEYVQLHPCSVKYVPQETTITQSPVSESHAFKQVGFFV